MRNRMLLYFLIALLIVSTFSYGFYFWQQQTKDKLTSSELKLLDELESIKLAGDYNFPPLSYTDSQGQYRGYEADLVAGLELHLGIPINYSQMIWEEALEALSSGDITAITGMPITNEKANLYNFTSPYWQTAYSFTHISREKSADLLEQENLTVLIQNRSAAYDHFLEYYYHDGVEFVYLTEPAEAIELLISEEADLWFEKDHVARHEVHITGMLDFLDLQQVPESAAQYALAFGPEYEELVPIFNKALDTLEQEGILSDLDQKWFGQADYRTEPPPWDLTHFTAGYIAFSLLILFLIWNRSLHIKVAQKTEELSKSEEKYKASFESSHDAILISDERGELVDCNKKALILFGFNKKEELLNSSNNALFPSTQPDGTDSIALFNKKIKATRDTKTAQQFEWVYKHQNGNALQCEVALTAFMLGKEFMIQQNICDITERKQIREKLEFLSLHDQLTGLYNRTHFESELYRLSDSKYYPLTLISFDVDSLKMINDSFGHQTGDQHLIKCASILKESLRKEDILARIGGDEFCAILPKTKKETGEKIIERINLDISKYNDLNPLILMSISIGLATTENPFIPADELIKKSDELMYQNKMHRASSAANNILKYLIDMLYEKDNFNNGHLDRMGKYCMELGKAFNLNEEQLENLKNLSKLHDLGKVAIPDEILTKQGKLNSQEWEQIKQHSEKGYRIARSSPEISGIAELILKHHECWDGTGYPVGLTGENIPIECRILAIVDAYDVMTNERPYAPVKNKQEALHELNRLAGRFYDPTLVQLFISLFPI